MGRERDKSKEEGLRIGERRGEKHRAVQSRGVEQSIVQSRGGELNGRERRGSVLEKKGALWNRKNVAKRGSWCMERRGAV